MLVASLSTTFLAAASETESAAQIQSVWDFVVKGGPMMVPIIICSLVALAVIGERYMSLRRDNIIPSDFLPGLKKALDQDGQDHSEALAYCDASDSPISEIFAAGIKRLSESVEMMEKHVQEAGTRVVAKLRKHLRVLTVTASICPLMGLLGTIFGMIEAFQTVAISSDALGKTELLAEGIYQAMITTAAGLLVAIPVIIAYHMISSKIEQLVDEMDRMAVEFVEEYGFTRGAEARNIRIQPGNADLADSASAAQS